MQSLSLGFRTRLWSIFLILSLSCLAQGSPTILCRDQNQFSEKLIAKLEACALRVFQGGYRNAGEELLCNSKVRIQTGSGYSTQNTGGLFDMPSPYLIKCSDFMAETNVGPGQLASALAILDGRETNDVPVFLLACTSYFKDLTQKDLGPWDHYIISLNRRLSIDYWRKTVQQISGGLLPGESLRGGIFSVNFQPVRAKIEGCKFFEEGSESF